MLLTRGRTQAKTPGASGGAPRRVDKDRPFRVTLPGGDHRRHQLPLHRLDWAVLLAEGALRVIRGLMEEMAARAEEAPAATARAPAQVAVESMML